jgi:hypothetical protein
MRIFQGLRKKNRALRQTQCPILKTKILVRIMFRGGILRRAQCEKPEFTMRK